MAITTVIPVLSEIVNDSPNYYEDISIRNNALVASVFPAVNTWATEANALATQVTDSAADAAASAQLALATGNYKGVFNPLTNYLQGDSISYSFPSPPYGNHLFVAKVNNVGHTPTIPTPPTVDAYWDVINSALSISLTPTGDVASTNVQSAIAELSTEKARIDGLGGYINSAPSNDITVTDKLGFWDASLSILSSVTFQKVYDAVRVGLATLESPVFTSNPTAPTPAAFDNDLSLATTEFVTRANGQIMICEDRKVAGVPGGTSIAGMNIRYLGADNTPVYNGIVGASLDSALSRITLPAGTYRLKATAPAYLCDTAILIFRNITNSINVGISEIRFSNDGGNYSDITNNIESVFTIASISEFELRHIISSAQLTYGLGGYVQSTIPIGYDGYVPLPHIYSRVIIERIA